MEGVIRMSMGVIMSNGIVDNKAIAAAAAVEYRQIVTFNIVKKTWRGGYMLQTS